LVRLDAELADIFKDATTVNSGLMILTNIAQEHVSHGANGSQALWSQQSGV